MSDKIVIMKGGEIQQVGTPQEIYNEPVISMLLILLVKVMLFLESW